ncbi:MAG TPA: TetR/AcrR family transcriptional regulator [Actinomycetota bacterium]|nr:TetR/AcrR family transcriptional regulator [Actinomycetota bacterium]
MSAQPVEVRGPGRPRSAAAHLAILEATLELFVEEGFNGMTIEGVAARAGVSKATIYRRWPSKEELVSEAVGTISEEIYAPDTGNVRDDLVRFVEQFAQLLASPESHRVFARMASEMTFSPQLGAIYKRNVMQPRRRLAVAVVERAKERGQLPEALDADLLIDMVVGALIMRALARDADRYPPGFAERLVDLALSLTGAQTGTR